MLIAHVLPFSCYEKKTTERVLSQPWPKIRLIWIQLVTACRKYCTRRCTKQASLIWSYRRRHWQMAAAMTTWSSLAHSVICSQSLFLFVQTSDACFHRRSQNFVWRPLFSRRPQNTRSNTSNSKHLNSSILLSTKWWYSTLQMWRNSEFLRF